MNLKRRIYQYRLNSKRNRVKNEVNWNIKVALGKEISGDSMGSESESREGRK